MASTVRSACPIAETKLQPVAIGLWQPTPKRPMYTLRQRRMMEAIRSGPVSKLVDEIYAMAKEDLKACSEPVRHPDDEDEDEDEDVRASVKSRSEAIIHDYESRSGGHLFKLLHTIHRDVIEALILDTAGWMSVYWEEFKKNLLPLDTCPGAYLVTFTVMGRNAGLTRNETRSLQQMIARYAKGKGRKISPQSSQKDVEAAAEAVEIELALRGPNTSRSTILAEVNEGKRWLHFKHIDVFGQQLENRIDENLDPVGNRSQIQTLCLVGSSPNMAYGASSHDPLILGPTEKPFGLVIACLQVMHLPTEIIRLAICKVFEEKEEQFQISGILGRFLASASIHDGNMSSMKPESQGIDDMHDMARKCEDVRYQLAVKAPWFEQQLDETKEVMVRIKEQVEGEMTWLKKARDIWSNQAEQSESEATQSAAPGPVVERKLTEGPKFEEYKEPRYPQSSFHLKPDFYEPQPVQEGSQDIKLRERTFAGSVAKPVNNESVPKPEPEPKPEPGPGPEPYSDEVSPVVLFARHVKRKRI